MNNPYLPKVYEILSITQETAIDYTYQVAYEGPLVGGQFMEISIPGVGEAPISICGFDGVSLSMTIRKVGRLTDQVFDLKPGDFLFMRGPYGNGFDLKRFEGQDVAFIAGGTGLAPIRKTIESLIQKEVETKKLEVLAGFKTSKDRLFIEDLKRWQDQIPVAITIDQEEAGWDGLTGLITRHLETLDLSQVENKLAVVVGPPIMMKFTTLELLKLGFKPDNIIVSFERKMSCGIGKCGHCKIDETYVCLEGPVFSYVKAKELMD